MKNKSSQESEPMSENEVETPSRKSRQQTITCLVSEAEANASLAKLKTAKDGSMHVLRFTRLERLIHFLLLVAVTGLSFTGVAQIINGNSLGRLMLGIMGGLDNTQRIHHIFAILLGGLSIFHFLETLDNLFVRRRKSAMFPSWIDTQAFIQMQLLNLGLSKKQPRFDRYSYEEKAVYWLFALGVLGLGLTGIIQWFPLLVTEILPGIVIPYAGIIHRWVAILVIFVIFIWHLYQVLFRKRDVSIFTGMKTRQDMQLEHALELEYLEKAAAEAGGSNWPVRIELALYNDLDGELN